MRIERSLTIHLTASEADELLEELGSMTGDQIDVRPILRALYLNLADATDD